MKKIFSICFVIGLALLSSHAIAETFWKTGKIKSTWSDNAAYSGCMIMLDVTIDNSCPANGFVSLDCMGQVYDNAENSKRLFADAMAAMHADKTVSVYVDNTKKVNGYCVARVIRVFK